MDDFISREFPELIANAKVRREVEIGTPYKRIVDKAEAAGVDMIVMSTHGRTGLAHMLIGSVTERVLRRAPCPVLAVPAPRRTKRLRKQTNTADRLTFLPSPEITLLNIGLI